MVNCLSDQQDDRLIVWISLKFNRNLCSTQEINPLREGSFEKERNYQTQRVWSDYYMET